MDDDDDDDDSNHYLQDACISFHCKSAVEMFFLYIAACKQVRCADIVREASQKQTSECKF